MYACLDHGPARNVDELRQAYGLAYRNYLKQGYCDPHPSGMRYTLKNSLPEVITFVGRKDSCVTATATLVPDTPLGLPMDSAFCEQANTLRSQRRNLAEVTLLADDKDMTDRKGALARLFSVFKLVFDYCRHLGIDDLMVTCNSNHSKFYTRYLKFERFGPCRLLDSVNNNIAIPLRLDMHRLDEIRLPHSGVKEFFIKNQTPPSVYARRFRHTADTLEEFYVDERPLLCSASVEELEYVDLRYPEVDVLSLALASSGSVPEPHHLAGSSQ